MIPLTEHNSLRVAIICSRGLGDMLIQMVIARNLINNGYEVHYYSDFAYQIRNYFNDIAIYPFPTVSRLKDECADKHIILYGCGSLSYVASLPPELQAWVSRRGVCFSPSSKPPMHQTITFDDMKAHIPESKHGDARHFLAFNAFARQRNPLSKRPAIVEQICRFLNDSLRLKEVSPDNGLTVPAVERNPRRVVVHPTSGSDKKNWHAPSYLELAERLKERRWQVVFTVAPPELDTWKAFTRGVFDCPFYPTIEELLLDYNQSAGFIGNNSGNGHLASNIGLPTLTIFNCGHRFPRWRPGWGKTKVVVAPFPYGYSKAHWKDHLYVGRVVKAFEQLMTQ